MFSRSQQTKYRLIGKANPFTIVKSTRWAIWRGANKSRSWDNADEWRKRISYRMLNIWCIHTCACVWIRISFLNREELCGSHESRDSVSPTKLSRWRADGWVGFGGDYRRLATYLHYDERGVRGRTVGIWRESGPTNSLTRCSFLCLPNYARGLNERRNVQWMERPQHHDPL